MNGFQDLGNLLGGGGEAAYQKAFDEGRYRSAQTEEALATARVNQQKSIETERRNKARTEMRANPTGLLNPTDDIMAMLIDAGAGEDYKNISAGMQDQQGIRFRDTVANVETPAEARLRALQAIEGRPSADVQAVGANDFVNLADELQVPTILDSASKELAQGGSDATTAIRNFNYANTLSPADRARFEPYVRNDVIANAGGVPVNTGFGGRGGPAPVVPTEQVATNAAQLAAAKAEGTQAGNQVAAAPGHVGKLDEMISSVDKLTTHPGFKTVYGPSGLLDPRNYVPGTDAQGARALLDNINAQSFLVSVKEMRGLGALSNAEGLKVQQAFTYATNPNLSDQESAEAWMDLRAKLDSLKAAAVKESQNSLIRPGVQPTAAGGMDMSQLSDEELQRIANGG